jgi:hypothetical protein
MGMPLEPPRAGITTTHRAGRSPDWEADDTGRIVNDPEASIDWLGAWLDERAILVLSEFPAMRRWLQGRSHLVVTWRMQKGHATVCYCLPASLSGNRTLGRAQVAWLAVSSTDLFWTQLLLLAG